MRLLLVCFAVSCLVSSKETKIANPLANARADSHTQFAMNIRVQPGLDAVSNRCAHLGLLPPCAHMQASTSLFPESQLSNA